MKLLLVLLGLLLVSLALAIIAYNSIELEEQIVYDKLSYTALAVEEEAVYWSKMPLTYNYSKCSASRIDRIEIALDEVEKLTDSEVSFLNFEDETDINFICDENSIVNAETNTKTLGETEIAYDLENNQIVNAKIYLYDLPDGCNYPDVEIHEVLHALGEKHNSNDRSIMNKVQPRCLNQINMAVDGIIFEKLKADY